jgi:hypothetical protein
MTNGVESPASSKYAFWYLAQCFADPRQPIASMPKIFCAQLFGARSRIVAKSGIRPVNQKSNDTVAYVDTANTSQISGLRGCGHSHIVFG